VTEATLDQLQQLLAERPPVSLEDLGGNPAAVLVLIYLKNNEYCLHFQKRPKNFRRHQGEVCFPGGTPEDIDADLLATALREAHEEEDILPQDVTLLGRMDDVPTRTGFTLQVYVGTIPYPYTFKPNAQEVEEIMEVPLKVLCDPSSWREEIRWVDGNPVTRYSYTYGTHIIYGATATIVDHFLEIIGKVQDNGRN